jgi:Kef-type K+ transport system membrane component KefB
VIAAAVVFLVVVAINSDGSYSLGPLLGRVALVLAVIYLLMRFVKWATRRWQPRSPKRPRTPHGAGAACCSG